MWDCIVEVHPGQGRYTVREGVLYFQGNVLFLQSQLLSVETDHTNTNTHNTHSIVLSVLMSCFYAGITVYAFHNFLVCRSPPPHPLPSPPPPPPTPSPKPSATSILWVSLIFPSLPPL